MKDVQIKWYPLGLDQRVEEHKAIDLKRAIEITDQYVARGSEQFKSDKEAIAATMFGFSKSKSDFIEICVNGPKQISWKFEFSDPDASWFQRLRNGTFLREDELQSRDELIQKVTEFFSHSSKQAVHRYKGKPNQSGRSPLGNRPNASVGIRIFSIILASVLGLCMAYGSLRAIDSGKIWWGGKYSPGFWVHKDRSPKAFWIWVIIYVAASIWMIRVSLLELKIVRRMLTQRSKRKSQLPND